VMNGFELVRQLAAVPALRTLPVVAVSASVFDYQQESSLQVGCSAFLGKPIRLPELLRVLEAELGLSWIYHDEPVETRPAAAAQPGQPVSATQSLSPPQAEALVLAARQGDISAILARLNNLEADPSKHSLVQRLRLLADEFDLEGIEALVAECPRSPA